MKKLFTLLTGCFIAIALNAAELNIYASGLQSGTVNNENKVEIQYFLNAPATALTLNIMNGETLVGTINLTEAELLTKGAHSTTVDLSSVPNGTYTWALTATGEATDTTPVQVNDETKQQFQFYLPQGVAVDNSFESPYFGRIYVSESVDGANDGSTPYTKRQKTGIFILDAGLTDITNQDSVGYSGNISWPINRQGPKRIQVDASGRVWVSDNSETNSGIYMMDPANPSADFTPVFADGTRDAEGTKTVNETAIHGKIAAFCLTGSGENTKLYTIENSLKINDKIKNILQYNVGALTAPHAAVYDAVIYANTEGIYANSDLAIVSDKVQGGFWVAQHRYQFDVHTALAHISAAGVMDFASTEENIGAFSGNLSYRAAVAVNNDGTLLAFGGSKTVKLFAVTYSEEGVPSLQQKNWVIPTIGNNIDGVAFDIADNLYAISASNERLRIYALPKTTNTTTTPAASTKTLIVTNSPVSGLSVNLADVVGISAAKGMLSVNAGNINLTGYAVYGFDGRLLLSEQVNASRLNIPIGHLSSGSYIIRCTSAQGVVSKKFIIH